MVAGVRGENYVIGEESWNQIVVGYCFDPSVCGETMIDNPDNYLMNTDFICDRVDDNSE